MKKLTLTLAGFILCINIFSQGTWEMISPKPTINDLHDIFFVTGQKGWAVGVKGTIVATSNGGETWDVQYTDNSKYFTGLFFLDENEGWVVGWHDLLHTTNGGETWEPQNVVGYLDLEKIQFINPDTGWIVGTYNRIYKTVDGGETWNLKLTGGTDSPAFNDLFFTDALHGVAVGGDWFSYQDDAYIMVTTDGGETWSETTPENVDELRSVYFISQDTGWACGYGEEIIKTVDGGHTWEIVSTYSYLKDDIHFFDNEHGIILSESRVLITNDGGITWSSYQTDMSTYVNSFSFYGSTGFASGYHGVLFKTTDYGENWEESGSHRYGEVEKMFFKDTLNGWGKYPSGSRLLRTNDGGLTWTPVDIGASLVLADYCFPTVSTGYAVEHHNMLYKTTDAGETWQSSNIGIPGYFNVIYFLNENKGFIGGDDGLLIKTTDGGESWSTVDISDYGWFRDMQFFDDENGWLLNHSGNIYKTTDGGNSWQVKGIGGTGNLNDMYFINPQKGFVTSLMGKLFMTEDGGDTWSQVFSFSQYANRTVIKFVNESEGWLSVSASLYYTTDGGYSWTDYPVNNYILDICFFNSNTGWISGSYSLMLKYNNQMTDVKETVFESFIVFPNPASDKITLSIPGLGDEHTLLNVYDLSGKLCFNRNMSNINGKITLDISFLPGGLYLFELKTPEKSKIIKVLKRN